MDRAKVSDEVPGFPLVKAACSECGDMTFTDDLYENGRCCDCDGQFCYCVICKEEQHIDSKCRHVFQDSGFEWNGSGVDWKPETSKDSFLVLLARMPQAFAVDLKKAIRSGQFYTFLFAPMIGGGGLLELHGMSRMREYGEAMIDIGSGDHAEECADGYSWLASLYQRDTPRANRLTVKWINEYITTAKAKGIER